MLKHATICRIKRAEQALAQSMEVPAEIDHAASPFVSTTTDPETIASIKQDDGDVNNNFQDKFASLLSNGNWLSSAKGQIGSNIVTSCSSSPTPSLQSTTMSRVGSLSSAPSSVFNSPSKAKPSLTDSMIKIYFDQINLNQVEYMTLPVNTQTKSQEIIRTLLRKLRLKHRDPNLFYLILERYIRKDGLKCKSAMILGSDACPLQLQRCCSNPPHNDIKFTLHMRPGALIKIFCDDVCPNSKYKCITLSPQTTVEETIELMLYCLNLAVPTDARKNSSIIDRSVSSAAMLSTHVRQASSPGSTDSASSSASSTSSSSGIESDPTSNQNNFISNQANSDCRRRLETPSRTGSVTSISSSSNFSNFSNGQSHSQQYCLVIECEDTNFEQVLGSEEYLVDAYQNLLDEVREQAQQQQPTTSGGTDTKLARSASLSSPPSIKHQPDQWFVVKLKRREELSNIKFTNPRQNMPLPPIPSSVVELSNANIKNFVSTTQIEVNNNQQHRPSHSIAIAQSNKSTVVATESSAITTMNASEPASWHQRNVSAVVISNSRSENKMEPPPAHLIWMPQVKPRRRNLSSASSTFGTQAPHSLASLTQPLSQTTSVSNGLTCGNRRRYDPAQLAEDLKQIDVRFD